MNSWPSATRQNQYQKVKRGKAKLDTKSEWDFPLPSEGAVSSVSLHQIGGRLRWTEIAGDNGRRLRINGRGVQIFPPTRCYKQDSQTRSIVRQAEASANFLRKAYPDIDVPSELIRDEIRQDAQVLQNRKTFDFAMGNTLETIFCNDGPRKRVAFLAFPMGETWCDLNLSPFVCSKSKMTVFKPIANPVVSFLTPIQQICTSKIDSKNGSSFFVVRTMGHTSLFRLQTSKGPTYNSYPLAVESSRLLPSDVGGRSLLDIQFMSSSALVLNDQRCLYEWIVDQGSKSIFHTYVDSENDRDDHFGKVAVTDVSSVCYLASSHVVRQIDLRSSARMPDLWVENRPNTYITSTEMPRVDRLGRVVTTKEILWFDERYPGKPVLGVKHGRERDRTLEVQTASVSDTVASFLVSKRSGFVSVYDVSRGPDELAHVNVPPYSLPSGFSSQDLPLMGHTLLRHHAMRESEIDILQLSSQGSVCRLNAALSRNQDESVRISDENFYQWNETVEELKEKARIPNARIDTLAEREYSVVNLQPAYNDCFMSEEGAEDIDSVYNIVDKMPTFWQESDVSRDHLLTIFDIAFRCGDEPEESSRADFLTQSQINSRRGFRAWKQQRLKISNHSGWQQDLARILLLFDSDISDDPQIMLDRLKSYNLSVDGDRTENSLEIEQDACEQLALDLGLSSHVYSGNVFSNSSQEDFEETLETVSLAAGALSLEDVEPASLQFGFLSPMMKRSVDHYTRSDEQTEEKKDLTPVGVRLLLQDWIVGVDPKEYVYEDPYKDDVRPRTVVPTQNGLSGQETSKEPIEASNQSQRPPVVNSTAPPQIVVTQACRSGGVGIAMMGFSPGTITTEEPESSQHMKVNTQPVPGPYGGRPVLGKKKPAKKRVGGF